MKNPKKSKSYWEEIFRKCNLQDHDNKDAKEGEEKKIEVNVEEINVKKLLETYQLDITNLEHQGFIEEVSRKAQKQYEIEKKLKEMEENLKKIDVEYQYNDKVKGNVLKAVDEVQ